MIVNIFFKTFKCLTIYQKIRFLFVAILNWFVQILELVGIAAFLPVIALFLNAESGLVNDISNFILEKLKEFININFFCFLYC